MVAVDDGGSSRGEGMVSHMQPNPAHVQIELCALSCPLLGLDPNGPWAGISPQMGGWGPCFNVQVQRLGERSFLNFSLSPQVKVPLLRQLLSYSWGADLGF